jgi:hypothetical protein
MSLKLRMPPPPLEKHEQEHLFSWAELMSHQYPELRLMYAIPNAGGYTGGFRKNVARVQAMRRQGVKKGVPDICLPVARGSWHSLYLEIKREGKDKPSKEQEEWHKALGEAGHAVAVAHGFAQAVDILTRYLNQPERRAP